MSRRYMYQSIWHRGYALSAPSLSRGRVVYFISEQQRCQSGAERREGARRSLCLLCGLGRAELKVARRGDVETAYLANPCQAV